MRSSARFVAGLLVVMAGLATGCGKTLAPAPPGPQAPETWLTDATTDTLSGATTAASQVRFHLAWAGSSRSGAIAGFRWALIETPAPAGEIASVATTREPGPRDWHFTAATETTLAFPLKDAAATRRVFLVTSIGADGAADGTPARIALQAGALMSKPGPTLEAEVIGTIVTLDRRMDPVLHRNQRFPLQPYVPGAALDTVPVGSTLRVRWHPAAGSSGPWDTTLTQAGVRQFTLQAPEGGGEVTLRFMVDFAPDTWWAGPDPARWPISTDGEGGRAVDVTDWGTFSTQPAWPPDGRPYFGPDSLGYIPAKRVPPGGDFQRRTFYEIWKNRIYARTEGDTVHMNSWVVLLNGGYDKDSEYEPWVDPADPALPADFATNPDRYPVLEDLGLMGSPVGFRSWIPMRLTPNGIKVAPAQTNSYPVYEPASVFRAPRLAGYWWIPFAGKAYALARSVDSDELVDALVTDPYTLADNVDAGGGTPAERLERRKVIVFYVDKAPALVKGPAFHPQEGQTFTTAQWTFNLYGMDLDPYMAEGLRGGPSATQIIRFKVTLYGKSLAGTDTSWTWKAPSGSPYLITAGSGAISFIPGGTMAANPFASGPITVSIQVCDCQECEVSFGQGRCVDGIDPGTGQVVTPLNVIHVNYVRPATP